MKNIIFGFILLITIVGCSSKAKIQQAWVDPNFHDKGLSGTLVVALTDNEESQQIFEKLFVKKLKAKGVRAQTSYQIKAGVETSEDIVAYAKKNGLDTVLVTHYLGANEKQIYHRGASYYRFDYFYGRAYEVAHSPSFYTTNKEIMLATTLYETATKEVLWEANSSILQNRDPRKLYGTFIDSFIKQLKKDGLTK